MVIEIALYTCIYHRWAVEVCVRHTTSTLLQKYFGSGLIFLMQTMYVLTVRSKTCESIGVCHRYVVAVPNKLSTITVGMLVRQRQMCNVNTVATIANGFTARKEQLLLYSNPLHAKLVKHAESE